MTNFEIARRMARNGWHMIPALPLEKQTFFRWKDISEANYSFDRIFATEPNSCNVAILCGEMVAVVDFDAHGPEPNGATIYRKIEEMNPELFKGAIVEITQSGGCHVYYRGTPGAETYKVRLTVGDVSIEVEVLAGRRLCYCWPSVTKKGKYVLTSSETFLNTRPVDLPRLPGLFERLPETLQPAPPVARSTVHDGDLTEQDMIAVLEYYENKDYGTGSRNGDARRFARVIVGLGRWGDRETERLIERYITSRGRELSDPGEARRILDYAKRKGGSEAIPWTAVMSARRQRQRDQVKRMMGG